MFRITISGVGCGEEIYRRFAPPETALSDDALLRYAGRSLALMAGYSEALDDCRVRIGRLKAQLFDVAAEFTLRYARPDIITAGPRPYRRLSGENLARWAEVLDAQADAASELYEDTDHKLNPAKRRWKAGSAEMVRRYLFPPLRAITVRRGRYAFSVWYDDEGTGRVAALPFTRSLQSEVI